MVGMQFLRVCRFFISVFLGQGFVEEYLGCSFEAYSKSPLWRGVQPPKVRILRNNQVSLYRAKQESVVRRWLEQSGGRPNKDICKKIK